MKIWKLATVVSIAAISGLVGSALTSRLAAADQQAPWTCPGHSNLTTAHGDLVNARQHMHDAQVANDYDMKGHAGKAEADIKDALGEVDAACKVLLGK